MRITKGQLRRIIREEANRFNRARRTRRLRETIDDFDAEAAAWPDSPYNPENWPDTPGYDEPDASDYDPMAGIDPNKAQSVDWNAVTRNLKSSEQAARRAYDILNKATHPMSTKVLGCARDLEDVISAASDMDYRDSWRN